MTSKLGIRRLFLCEEFLILLFLKTFFVYSGMNQVFKKIKYLNFRNVILPILWPHKFRITDLRFSLKT